MIYFPITPLSQQLKDVVFKVDHLANDLKNLKRYFRGKLKDCSNGTSVPLHTEIVLYTSEKVYDF